MQREHLEHLIRAAGAISGSKRIVVIGSQSILGQFPRGAPARANFAGREKDREFCLSVVAAGLVSQAELLERLAVTEVDAAMHERMLRAIEVDFSQRGSAIR